MCLLQCLVTCEGHYMLWAILKMVCTVQANASYIVRVLKKMFLSKMIWDCEGYFIILYNSASLLNRVPRVFQVLKCPNHLNDWVPKCFSSAWVSKCLGARVSQVLECQSALWVPFESPDIITQKCFKNLLKL